MPQDPPLAPFARALLSRLAEPFLDSSAQKIRLRPRIDQIRRSLIQAFKELQRLQSERPTNRSTLLL
jgi:hypothetical protein